jgi:hypothetical protein
MTPSRKPPGIMAFYQLLVMTRREGSGLAKRMSGRV